MRWIIVIAVLLCIDVYVFQGVKVLTSGKEESTQRFVYSFYWFLTILAVSTLVLANFTDWHTWPRIISSYLFAFIVIVYLSKIFVLLFLITDDVVRLFRWGYIKAEGLIHSSNKTEPLPGKPVSRLGFLVKLGFIVGAIPFVSMIYGMIKGATDFTVRRRSVKYKNLPEAFNGLKIVQISDLHLGSFFSDEPLRRAIHLINDQKPDVILFTGDLVNDLHDEAVPYKELLKEMKAPMGVYSVLGNHDYGEYYRWKDTHDKLQNLERLIHFQRDLGWKLLLNEHTYLEKGGERIALIGVENWSARGFQKYGDMKKAVEGLDPVSFHILMSHDPSHWRAEVLPEYSFVDLTLSGHTHGMQFGVEIPGFKWSPVQYIYKEWADLYNSNNQRLYVNRGLGFIGYPGRVGILPEITVLTLEKS
jgi:predicted MPP superfamily phosphohydrolase